jgi:hypothetical protein
LALLARYRSLIERQEGASQVDVQAFLRFGIAQLDLRPKFSNFPLQLGQGLDVLLENCRFPACWQFASTSTEYDLGVLAILTFLISILSARLCPKGAMRRL